MVRGEETRARIMDTQHSRSRGERDRIPAPDVGWGGGVPIAKIQSLTPPIRYVKCTIKGNLDTIQSCYVRDEDLATLDSQYASCSASSMG